MVKIRKYANFIERFLHGEKGQRFFNFAYSIGAAIVIWGALFKILHLPGGNTLLCIGMGTEIAMFLLTAFDRPPKEYAWEEVFPVLDSRNPNERPDFSAGGGGVIAVGGVGAPGAPANGNGQDVAPTLSPSAAYAGAPVVAADPASAEHLQEIMTAVAEQMEQLRQSTQALNEVSSVLLSSYKAITENSDSISDSASGYAQRMADLNRNLGGLNTIYEI